SSIFLYLHHRRPLLEALILISALIRRRLSSVCLSVLQAVLNFLYVVYFIVNSFPASVDLQNFSVLIVCDLLFSFIFFFCFCLSFCCMWFMFCSYCSVGCSELSAPISRSLSL